MDYEENMVENDIPEGEAPEEVVEESYDSEESLDSVIEEEGGSAEEEAQPEEKPQGTGSEPGWFQKRWSKEVGKLSEQIRSEVRNEYEAKIAPLQARLLEMDAQELVKTGQVKDIKLAREIVNLRNGMNPPAEEPTPRNDKGQFQSREQIAREAGTDAHIMALKHQAERIAEKGGPNVIEEFQKNPEIKRKVINKEMDFYDVAEYMKSRQKKRSPAPMRSPNGASGNAKPNAIENMSDEQFARMEKRIREGARIALK